MIHHYVGKVRTTIGPESEFEFDIDDDDLPDDPAERKLVIREIAIEAFWESVAIEWDYKELGAT